MTDIDKMTPKQLGIAVAREVMGWREGYEWHEGDTVVWCNTGADHLWILRPTPKNPWYNVKGYVWASWNDKNDMWEVIEKMRADYYRFCIVQDIYSDVWEVMVDDRYYQVVGNADSVIVNEAVLRAGLMAVRGARNGH